MQRPTAVWPVLVALLAAVPAAAAESDKIRGITLSTHRSGQEWASDEIGPTLDDLRALGANWVAIHPYARIGEDGSVRFAAFDPGQPPPQLTRPIAEAHARGLKILVTPHLAYWGSPFSWRGEIEFDSEEEWQRFFDQYRRWLVAVAEACSGADALSLGNELDRTIAREREWREIIAAVRERTRAPLTYGANWSDYRNVPFWDAVDAIGIQAYFPLSETDDPSEDDLRRAWSERMAELRSFAVAHDKYLVFTELGYNRSWDAARRPWDYRVDGPEAGELQRRLTRVALEAIDREQRVVGVFLWKWFPRPRSMGRDFQLADPQMQQVIRTAWRR